MKDYIREMMDAWTGEGEQAAYDVGKRLLKEIESAFAYLRRQESAINALGSVLQEHANVDTTAEPVESTPGLDTIEPSERSRLITEAATEVWGAQQDSWGGAERNLVSIQSVLEALNNKGLDLGVKQPFAVIGTVLASADGFKKIARNTFEYTQPGPVVEIEDAPW